MDGEFSLDDLDAIKSDPGVLRVYGKYVRGLKKAGDKWVGCCPLPGHNDKTPSFFVFADGRCSCFGCGENLNIFQLVQKMDNCDFKTALEKVKKEVGHTDWIEAKQKTESTFKSVTEKKEYRTLSLSEYKPIEDNLLKSPEAIRWLEKERGISLATAQKLHIGFKPSLTGLKDEGAADILDKGWMVFPCIDGDLVRLMKYRSIVRKKPGGFQRHYGMETVLFGLESIDPFEPLWVVEGEPDRCVMEQAGFPCVSVQFAGDKVSPEMKDRIMGAPEVFLAGDNDGKVGNDCMERLWKELGKSTFYLKWPEGMKDANQTFLEHCGRDPVKFQELVRSLSSKAKSQPMPAVYSLQETMRSGDDLTLSDHPDRFRFPWSGVDKMVNIMPGDVVGINATNTGMGKSTWVVQTTMHNARKYGRCILNYQTEMRPSEIATMVSAQILRKDRNFLTGDDKKIAAGELEGVSYYVGSDPVLSDINQVLDLLESAIKRLSPYAVVLDHFHHLTTGMNNEAQIQSAAMTRIKSIAEIYKVVFINVGQPRKATQQTKGKQIHLTDAKGSAAWADAANAVITIHRDLNKSEDPTMAKGAYEDKTLVKLLKGRSMGTGNSACYLTSFGEFASFEQLDSMHGDQHPDD